eukprot:418719-Pleurochrysis_carterae.AAC.1
MSKLLRFSRQKQEPQLPDGSAFSPPWTPHDDVLLGDAMQIESVHLDGPLSLHIPKLAAQTEFLQGIQLFIKSSEGGRDATIDEMIQRITSLCEVFGDTRQEFERFRVGTSKALPAVVDAYVAEAKLGLLANRDPVPLRSQHGQPFSPYSSAAALSATLGAIFAAATGTAATNFP